MSAMKEGSLPECIPLCGADSLLCPQKLDLGGSDWSVTNTLAYYGKNFITTVKVFMIQGPEEAC